MDRRMFVSAVAGGVLAAPGLVRAQQPVLPVIGFLRSATAASSAFLVSGFREGLNEGGFVEGRNVAIEYRFAEGQAARLPALAADLVRRPVAVITAAGNEALIAAKAATATIPIVFASGDDPVKLGFVTSLSRPGGNVTGVSFVDTELVAKRLELLREVIPKVITVAVLLNPNNPSSDLDRRNVETAAHSLGQQILVLSAASDRDFERAFATFVQQRVGGLVVGGGAFFLGRRDQITALAARHAIPAIYGQRGFVAAGGLMSYGSSITDAYRQVGIYVGRILKGARPMDLPVTQPTKFELVINLQVAKALGLTIPPSVLARADEVIQ
jgi:putative ABC transport system substrate-binding protein